MNDKRTADFVAKQLWAAGCVTIKSKPTFRWASGLKSPIYTDNRLLLSHPKARRAVTTALLELIRGKRLGCDVVAGVATSGIPLASIVADRLNKPLIYVRPQAKSHGRGRQIEGDLKRGARVILIEDLVSTGASSLTAARALQKAGGRLEHILTSFAYLPELAVARFAKAGYRLHVLSDADTLLRQGRRSRAIGPRQEEATRAFLERLAASF